MIFKKSHPSRVLWQRVWLSLAVLSLAGCVSRSEQEAATAAGRLHGNGFSIAPPPGDGWTIGSRKPDAIVFHKHPGKAVQRPDSAPYVLNAGVLALANDATGNGQGVDFIQAARHNLAQRMSSPDQETILLEVTPASLRNATCAAYRAVQVDRYLPEKTEPRNAYAHRGLLCVHPGAPKLLIQAFYTERFLREAEPAQRASADEAQAFFSQLQFTAPK